MIQFQEPTPSVPLPRESTRHAAMAQGDRLSLDRLERDLQEAATQCDHMDRIYKARCELLDAQRDERRRIVASAHVELAQLECRHARERFEVFRRAWAQIEQL